MQKNHNINKQEELLPAYSEMESSSTQPSLPPTPLFPYPNIQPTMTIPQVVVASTLQPIPIRIHNGQIYLTVLEPVRMYCPFCNTNTQTIVELKPTCCAYTSCFILFYVCTPLCFLPFCMNDCRQQIHSCGRCENTLAIVGTAV
jgi:lipopolysaccharide-induced tumor necrosis factor-alpha factor